MDDCGTDAHIVAELGRGVRGRVPWQAYFFELRVIELVICCEDCGLIVRCTIRAEERSRHKLQVAAAKGVGIVDGGEDNVTNEYADCKSSVISAELTLYCDPR
jgi:hypothetical protein